MSYGILLLVLIPLIITVLMPIIHGEPMEAILVAAAIVLVVLAFVLHIFFNTTYRISHHELRIKCGFLYYNVIDINTIRAVYKTRSLMSSPAASLDRIEIKYGKWDSVIISPRHKLDFLNELLQINPNIIHDLK